MEVWNMQWNLAVCKNGKPLFVSKYMGQNKWVYTLFGPLASPRRYANFLGMCVTLCLAKESTSSQIFPPLAWQCSRILVWSVVGIFSHLPTCSKSQDCFGLGSIFCCESKRKSNTYLKGWWGTTLRSVFLPCNKIGSFLWNPLNQHPAWVSAFWKISWEQECQEGIHLFWSFQQWDALQHLWPQSCLGLYGLDWHPLG